MGKTKRGFKDTGYVPILNLGGEGVLKTKHFCISSCIYTIFH